jgi:hypothetical protein
MKASFIFSTVCLFNRGRGRPRLTSTAVVPPLEAGRQLSEVERYRRGRELNNEASRRCRMKRKEKQEPI